jgi:hypothetical protein
VRHPGAHHPGRFGHIDGSNPLQDLLILLIKDLGLLHHHALPCLASQQTKGCPRASVRKPKS